MATADMIRVSTDTLEDIQAKLNMVRRELESSCSAVRSWASRIDKKSGADVMVAVSGKLLSSGDVKSVLESCNRALRTCEQESLRLTRAINASSTLFTSNENKLVSNFNGADEGSASTHQGGGDGGAAEEGGASEEEKSAFIAGMMDFLQNLLSMGDDGQKIFAGIMAAIRAFGGSLSAQAMALSNMSLSAIMKSSAAEALFGKMSGLAVAAFVMKVATGVASDIQNGVAADRIVCNAIGNTVTAAITTIGGAVVGDVLATGILAAVAAIPGAQAAVVPLSYVVYPLCNAAATMGIDALMGMEVFGQPVSEYINDAVYAAYNGITEGIEYAKEAFSTIADYAQTGAEVIQQGFESAVDYASDVIDTGMEMVSDAIDNGKEFVNNAIDAGREAVSDFGETVYDGFSNIINGGLSWLGA